MSAIGKSLAMIEFKPDGTILTANENFCAAMGYDLDEIVGRHHAMFVDPAFAASAEYAAFWEKLSRGEYDTGQYKRFGKGGREVWIEASYNPVFHGRKMTKVLKLATDITAVKLAAAENRGKIEALSRSQAVIEFKPDGTIVTANENFCATMGYRLEDIVGRHHSMFVEPGFAASEEYRGFWAKLARGEFVSDEFERVGKGGRKVYIQASYNPIFDMNGRVVKVVKFATDVTGRVVAVNTLADGLGRMADGDVGQRLTEPFIPSLDRLRLDFNTSVAVLGEALTSVSQTADSIRSATEEIRIASDDLARRTEQQAASVEETSAAIEELNGTVRASAVRAEEAGVKVSATKSEAEHSGAVVDRAVTAMTAIEGSSHQISKIIGVIDEIAFQTNLLALNAGVEAARAGEAGRGFAVVASEVRGLAQRSAEAAKEIKGLIHASSRQVEEGVMLVRETGKALREIVARVQTIDADVGAIVEAARQQATGLSEIARAVGSIDEGTQQNATMVEESTAACHNLVEQMRDLRSLLSRFSLGDATAGDAAGSGVRDLVAGVGARDVQASLGAAFRQRTGPRLTRVK
ncbi:PAS domain-containing methyl-accepting chemotaxis protein [Jiella sp. MQZ13P-4]|uniref:PAS domain-containing methyl-accepting chemotaxis protein n=2 Tax=Jiella sonneratiae TaxID=2816856 RepID=A0ABS3J9B2_9HYPH|nr:PAS domain-containing methyl-accepting chemotaxis protein [Jiella sonneratiae]